MTSKRTKNRSSAEKDGMSSGSQQEILHNAGECLWPMPRSTQPEEAEMRGLPAEGVNAHWSSATCSRSDAACAISADVHFCAD